MSRNRSWCFTINNPTQTDLFGCKQLQRLAKYLIVGNEVGEKGTPHYQGYVSLENPMSMKALSKILTRARLVVSAGTDKQNQTYCSKEQVILEHGEPSEGQGKRTDIKEIADLIKSHQISLEELMFEYPDMYLKYSRSFEKMFNAVMTARESAPEVHWRWGLAGTGKTRYCIETHPDHYVKDGTMWWDGYKQNEAIIIDDFDNAIPYRTLLRMLDRYQYQGQVKGGYVQIDSPYIYITCEHAPEYFWSGNELAQIKRRITSVQEIK